MSKIYRLISLVKGFSRGGKKFAGLTNLSRLLFVLTNKGVGQGKADIYRFELGGGVNT